MGLMTQEGLCVYFTFYSRTENDDDDLIMMIIIVIATITAHE